MSRGRIAGGYFWAGLAAASAGAVLAAVAVAQRSPPPDRVAAQAAAPRVDAVGVAAGDARSNSPSPLAELVAAQQARQPKFIDEDGVRLEDEPHVRALLGSAVRCRYWSGGDAGESATLLDLLRLRRMGYASLPADYEVRHEQAEGADYVVVREHLKNRDGSDLRGMPGYVEHLYVDDPARGRFEHLRSTADDPHFEPHLLRSLGDPLGFLALHGDAVCNGRRALAENRSAPAPRQSARPRADAGPIAQNGGGAAAARVTVVKLAERSAPDPIAAPEAPAP